MNASVFNIQRLSYVDGPGIRTTVFFKGCNLSCKWCHNPESQASYKQRMISLSKCKHCEICKKVCPNHLKRCDLCETCVKACPNKAIEICGYEISEDCLFNILEKDIIFYSNSNGGVTFSGGECMLQIDFLKEILKRCMKKGIHTAVDTAGNVPWEYFERILPYTDMFLYDIKLMDEKLHKKYTGVSNKLILDNLKRLLQAHTRIWVRIPIIPNINLSEVEMRSICRYFDQIGYPEKIELLPYHKTGESKYLSLGLPNIEFLIPDKEQMLKMVRVLLGEIQKYQVDYQQKEYSIIFQNKNDDKE